MLKLLVLFYVMSPLDLPRETIPDFADDSDWQFLKDMATALEISGPNCRWTPSFRSECSWVRRKRLDCLDFPSIYDCRRLPPQDVCYRHLCFVTQRLTWLEAAQRERLYLREFLNEVIGDVRRQVDFWRTASDALEESNFWCRRRESLGQLRCIIGTEAYMAGAWPSPVLAGQ